MRISTAHVTLATLTLLALAGCQSGSWWGAKKDPPPPSGLTAAPPAPQNPTLPSAAANPGVAVTSPGYPSSYAGTSGAAGSAPYAQSPYGAAGSGAAGSGVYPAAATAPAGSIYSPGTGARPPDTARQRPDMVHQPLVIAPRHRIRRHQLEQPVRRNRSQRLRRRNLSEHRLSGDNRRGHNRRGRKRRLRQRRLWQRQLWHAGERFVLRRDRSRNRRPERLQHSTSKWLLRLVGESGIRWCNAVDRSGRAHWLDLWRFDLRRHHARQQSLRQRRHRVWQRRIWDQLIRFVNRQSVRRRDDIQHARLRQHALQHSIHFHDACLRQRSARLAGLAVRRGCWQLGVWRRQQLWNRCDNRLGQHDATGRSARQPHDRNGQPRQPPARPAAAVGRPAILPLLRARRPAAPALQHPAHQAPARQRIVPLRATPVQAVLTAACQAAVTAALLAARSAADRPV